MGGHSRVPPPKEDWGQGDPWGTVTWAQVGACTIASWCPKGHAPGLFRDLECDRVSTEHASGCAVDNAVFRAKNQVNQRSFDRCAHQSNVPPPPGEGPHPSHSTVRGPNDPGKSLVGCWGYVGDCQPIRRDQDKSHAGCNQALHTPKGPQLAPRYLRRPSDTWVGSSVWRAAFSTRDPGVQLPRPADPGNPVGQPMQPCGHLAVFGQGCGVRSLGPSEGFPAPPTLQACLPHPQPLNPRAAAQGSGWQAVWVAGA